MGHAPTTATPTRLPDGIVAFEGDGGKRHQLLAALVTAHAQTWQQRSVRLMAVNTEYVGDDEVSP